jgi:hypothetical protein
MMPAAFAPRSAVSYVILTGVAGILPGLFAAEWDETTCSTMRWEGLGMRRTRSLRLLVVSVLAAVLGLLFVVPAATAYAGTQSSSLPVVSGAVVAPDAPTNPRVTQLTPTSVTFQWDHPQPWPQGCTLGIFQYSTYLDGQFYGYTYIGSPVGLVSRLRPGSTHELAVQARDNCSGLWSPLSDPLAVTTPAA